MSVLVCINCKESLPEDKRADTLYCSKKCANRCRGKRHRDNNPEYYRQKRLQQDSDIPRRILSRVKCRAKRCGIPFNLGLEDITVPKSCPVLGIELFSIAGAGTNQYHSPSLDRIIPELGYIKGNVRVISQRANLLKSNATLEELELVLEDARRLYLNICF